MDTVDVIVIGAGAAGLGAARALMEAGRKVVIVEARERVGGRIRTVRDSAFGMPVELGAEFVHGRPEATWELLREFGLVAYDLPFDHFQKRRGRLVHVEDFEEELGKVMNGLPRAGRDVSFGEHLRKRCSSARLREACKMARAFVEGFDAADPEKISGKSIAAELKGVGNLEEETQFRLVDGYGALVDHLWKRLDGRVDLRLRTVVREVVWERGRVEVRCGSGPVFRAARAIVTLPLGVLRARGGEGAVKFSPELPGREAIEQLEFGSIVKAVLRFDHAFWEDKGAKRAARADAELKDAVFMHDPDAEFPTFWTMRPLRVPALTAWAGGPKAAALAGKSERELTAAAIGSLAGLVGLSEGRLRGMLRGAHAYDWASDPYARGAYSYVGVGGTGARKKLARPVKGTLFFAGEAVDTSGQASTVAGALASGKAAARAVLRAS
jgi:monoamine oxidase